MPDGTENGKGLWQKANNKVWLSAKISVYQAQNCNGCALRTLCHKSKHNRKIERNHKLERHKSIMRERLTSEQGQIKRRKRTADVEPVFGHIKSNRNFKRFTHKGIKKAELEFGLHALAHNIRKKVAWKL